MCQVDRLFRALIVASVLLGLPVTLFAHGGGGGGGHGGGGMRGGHSVSSGVRGYTGGGYRGPGAGYRGHFAGYRGYGGAYRGYGWGYPGYGWGYPYYGYGLGLGLGLGYGLGAGYGYGGYGYGYPAYGTYYGSATYYNANTVPTSVVATASTTPPDDPAAAKTQQFIERGELAFRTAKYADAVYAFRHAVVDAPQNPMLLLQLSQSLFATGKYEEAAGATQAAMRQLPKEEWGAVVNHYQDFYGNSQDYTNQLRALEKAIKHKPNEPALRFLAGYHYGYLGFFKQSVAQLDKVVEIESRDEIAKQLRDEMKSHIGNIELPAPAPIEQTSWKTSR